MAVDWKVGVEIELIAPRGHTRRDLALALAGNGTVHRFFHPQSEPSAVPGTPLFENLTLGFEARDHRGEVVARCVDDLTLQDDCDRSAAPRPGWYRIVSDDGRLLRLLVQNADAEHDLPGVLRPFAALFGVEPEPWGDMWRVADRAGASLLIGAPLPGERERPCELITPPMLDDHADRLERMLSVARELGFFAPAEGAVHLHFDAASLQSARFVRNIVRAQIGADWHQRFATNPRCRRLGPPPQGLADLVETPGFADIPWDEARSRLAALNLKKWVDVNLVNLVNGTPHKHTVEIRILPVSLHAGPIVAAMELFAEVLRSARQ